MKPSEFTYPRPVIDDVARAFASARSRCWCQPQLVALDLTIDLICDDMADYYDGFDPERFKKTARYFTDRTRPILKGPLP